MISDDDVCVTTMLMMMKMKNEDGDDDDNDDDDEDDDDGDDDDDTFAILCYKAGQSSAIFSPQSGKAIKAGHVTAIALDWLHVKVSAARGLQDMIVKKPHLLKPIQRLLKAVQHF